MRQSDRALLAIAVVLHAPGLRLLRGYRIGRRTRRANMVAILVTAGAVGLTLMLTDSAAWPVLVWSAGHLLWGVSLAAAVRRGSAAK